VSEAARFYRLAAWAAAGFAGLLLVLAVGGLRGWVPRELGVLSLLLFFAALLLSLWCGIVARRRALADRERQMSGAVIVAIAAQLGRQDDATLERIAAGSGPAAEAARLILQGRAEKRCASISSSPPRSP
jgi:hypothetical protein